jgi:pSer/pThr/pTyr-binding forkhead associated (FHA) protein
MKQKKRVAENKVTDKLTESDTYILGAFELPKDTVKHSDDLNLRQIALFLPGGRKPIVVENHDTITLGRKDEVNEIDPVVDLTEYHAKGLGVSRKHCELIFVNFNYYVRDAGSMNGTWLNAKRLEPDDLLPVSSGDALRLGSLMIVIG